MGEQWFVMMIYRGRLESYEGEMGRLKEEEGVSLQRRVSEEEGDVVVSL